MGMYDKRINIELKYETKQNKMGKISKLKKEIEAKRATIQTLNDSKQGEYILLEALETRLIQLQREGCCPCVRACSCHCGCDCNNTELLGLDEYVIVSVAPLHWAIKAENVLNNRYGAKNIIKKKDYLSNGYHHAWKFYRKEACVKCMTPINTVDLGDRANVSLL